MDIKRALPRSQLRSVVRSFQERRAELGSAVLTWPVAARPHQILNIHLAEPYRVRIGGGPANATPELSVVGPQTYRRAHVYLSGSLHVFNILFQPTGLNRLVGINMTSLLNHDPAAEDVLGRSAVTLGDAVRAATDFRERVAAVERWVGMMLDKSEPAGAICHASRLLIAAGPCADRAPRCKVRSQHEPVSASVRDTGGHDAKTVRTNDPVRQSTDRPPQCSGQALDRHHPRTGLLRSGPLHPRMPCFRRPPAWRPHRRLGQYFFPDG